MIYLVYIAFTGASFYPNESEWYPNEPEWYPNDTKFVYNWYIQCILCTNMLHKWMKFQLLGVFSPISFKVNPLIFQPNFVDTLTNHKKHEMGNDSFTIEF